MLESFWTARLIAEWSGMSEGTPPFLYEYIVSPPLFCRAMCKLLAFYKSCIIIIPKVVCCVLLPCRWRRLGGGSRLQKKINKIRTVFCVLGLWRGFTNLSLDLSSFLFGLLDSYKWMAPQACVISHSRRVPSSLSRYGMKQQCSGTAFSLHLSPTHGLAQLLTFCGLNTITHK